MQNFKLLTQGINIKPLMQALDARPDMWDQITIRQNFPGTAHADTQCIYVRGPEAFTYEKYMMDLGSYDYPAAHVLRDELVPIMKPIIEDILQATKVGRVLIVKMKPGGMLVPHIDEGQYADHFSRFHLCLTGGPGSTLTAGDESQHFAPGELWWFDHKAQHTAKNDEPTDRIHVIIDAVTSLFPMPRCPYENDKPIMSRESGARTTQIRRSDVSEMQALASDLFADHWDEVAKNKHVMVLNPDWTAYKLLESQHKLLVLAAFIDGKLVGYSANIINRHLHYFDLVICNNDILFVHKDHRSSPVGLRLIRETEKMAKQAGAQMMLWHAKQQTALDKIMPKLKYQVQDIIYSKEI